MSTEISRYKDLGSLHELLLTACPPDERGKRSIPVLATYLKISHQYIYRWIEKGIVPQKYAGKIVALSDGRVRLEQFHPYLF